MKQNVFWSAALMVLFTIMLVSSPVAAIAADSITIDVTIRDFKTDEILFNSGLVGADDGLVEGQLGANKKPAFISQRWFALAPNCTQAMLDALYNDTPGVNMRATKTLTLSKDIEGYYAVDPSYIGGFFPIDNELFGNEGLDHNYLFSTEYHGTFVYQGFEAFEFTTDDDGWVFINNKLVINRGGLHSAETPIRISMPDLVTGGILDIKSGDKVDIDVFHIERLPSGSAFYIRTNMNLTPIPTFNNMDFDPDFLAVLREKYPSLFNNNGEIIPAAVENFGNDGVSMDVAGKGLKSVKGIKNFVSLRELNCSYNDLTELDLAGLNYLKALDCNVNKLTKLDLTGLKGLESVTCNRNNLTEIKVSGLSKLEDLGCGTNQLSTIDFTGLSSLQSLYCDNNQFKTLDVTSLSKLVLLWCYSNQLTDLKVTGLNDLLYIYCYDNQLTGLDVSQNAKLELLFCADNYMTSPDSVKGWQALGLIINTPDYPNSGSFRYYMQTTPATGKPAITTSSLPSGTVGTTYRQTLTATGDAIITWSLMSGTLPNGLTLAASGAISGTPTIAGAFSFTVRAANNVGSDTKAFSITIDEENVYGCNAGFGILIGTLAALGFVVSARKR